MTATEPSFSSPTHRKPEANREVTPAQTTSSKQPSTTPLLPPTDPAAFVAMTQSHLPFLGGTTRPRYPSPLSEDQVAFLYWVADLLHYVQCEDCRKRLPGAPAPALDVAVTLAALQGDPVYQQVIRRLGGFLAAPTLMQQELDSLETLRLDREDQQVERLRRYLLAKELLRSEDCDLMGLVERQEMPPPGVDSAS